MYLDMLKITTTKAIIISKIVSDFAIVETGVRFPQPTDVKGYDSKI